MIRSIIRCVKVFVFSSLDYHFPSSKSVEAPLPLDAYSSSSHSIPPSAGSISASCHEPEDAFFRPESSAIVINSVSSSLHPTFNAPPPLTRWPPLGPRPPPPPPRFHLHFEDPTGTPEHPSGSLGIVRYMGPRAGEDKSLHGLIRPMPTQTTVACPYYNDYHHHHHLPYLFAHHPQEQATGVSAGDEQLSLTIQLVGTQHRHSSGDPYECQGSEHLHQPPSHQLLLGIQKAGSTGCLPLNDEDIWRRKAEQLQASEERRGGAIERDPYTEKDSVPEERENREREEAEEEEETGKDWARKPQSPLFV